MLTPQPRTRDFSKKRPPVNFTVDDVRYDCYKALDLNQLAAFANLARGFSESSRELSAVDVDEENASASINNATVAIDKIASLMKIVMKKASYAVFIAKLHPTDEEREADDFEPIDVTQLLDIIKWLMEAYTGRPTRPSSSSSSGSETDDAGTSSEDGASLEELTQYSSTPADSLT